MHQKYLEHYRNGTYKSACYFPSLTWIGPFLQKYQKSECRFGQAVPSQLEPVKVLDYAGRSDASGSSEVQSTRPRLTQQISVILDI